MMGRRRSVASTQDSTGPQRAGGGPTDSVLLDRVRRGNEQAFEELFARYADAIRGRIAQWLPHRFQRRVSVADILQEVRITAFQRLPEFEHRGPGSFRNWLLRIAQLKVQGEVGHHGRAAKRAVGLEVSRGARPDTAAFAGAGPSPSQAAMAAEFQQLAQKALAVLTDEQREVLRLVREERMPLREVAERLGRTYEATKRLHGRALLKLTTEFERLGGNRG
jgi:RNA polymerase sigma-70 factor (ECF subfamily)